MFYQQESPTKLIDAQEGDMNKDTKIPVLKGAF